MAFVLTTASNVTCGHGPGKVLIASTAKLAVGGAPVLLEDSVAGKSVSPACAIVPAADASGTPTHVKCTTVVSVDAGKATKLFVGGKPVILDTLGGKTSGMDNKVTPQTKLGGSAGHQKLRAT